MDASRILAEILAIAADAIVVIDEEQRIVLFSRGAEEVFGRAAEEMRGQPLDLLLPGDVRDAHRGYVRSFEGSPVASRLMGERGEIRGRRRSGELFPAEASISRLEVDGRRLYAAVLRDVSDRERAEAERIRSQAELAEAQRLARLGSWEWEVGSGALHCSDELHRIFGSEPSASPMSYADFLERVHPDDREPLQSTVERALKEGADFEIDHRIVRPDGSVRTLHGRGRVVLDDDGKPVRMVGTGQDVTERREAEERSRALAREQAARAAAETAAERFRFLAEAGRILGSSLDVEQTLRSVVRLAVPRIADWCVLHVTESSGRLRLVELADGDPDRERVAREAYVRYQPDLASADPYTTKLRSGRAVLVSDVSDADLRAVARDEEHLELLRSFGLRSALSIPLRVNARPVGLLSLATAESGRRLGPEDLSLATSLGARAALAIENARLFEDARAVARAREQAVATVSHDLRNPLGSIATNVGLLRDPELPPEARESTLDRLDRIVGSMNRMIRDLLDVTRLEGGGVELQQRPVPVSELVSEACDLVHRDAGARSVQIETEVEPGLRARVDRDRAVQVLGNLLDNAVRHSPEGASVRLEARDTGRRILLSVSDQGEGVPPEQRERIFHRFWQGAARRQGAGLGLAIARGLVELHGGEIWVEPAEAGGARFCFTLEADAPRDGGARGRPLGRPAPASG